MRVPALLAIVCAGSAAPAMPAECDAATGVQAAIAACLDAASAARDAGPQAWASDDRDGPRAHLQRVGGTAKARDENCVGYAAARCMATTTDGMSTLGAAACLRREAAAWDARLNASYAQILVIATPSARDGYRRAARTWLAYRDATCAVPAKRLGTHDRVVPLTSDCLLSLTARQALHLRGELADLR